MLNKSLNNNLQFVIEPSSSNFIFFLQFVSKSYDYRRRRVRYVSQDTGNTFWAILRLKRFKVRRFYVCSCSPYCCIRPKCRVQDYNYLTQKHTVSCNWFSTIILGIFYYIRILLWKERVFSEKKNRFSSHLSNNILAVRKFSF